MLVSMKLVVAAVMACVVVGQMSGMGMGGSGMQPPTIDGDINDIVIPVGVGAPPNAPGIGMGSGAEMNDDMDTEDSMEIVDVLSASEREALLERLENVTGLQGARLDEVNVMDSAGHVERVLLLMFPNITNQSTVGHIIDQLYQQDQLQDILTDVGSNLNITTISDAMVFDSTNYANPFEGFPTANITLVNLQQLVYTTIDVILQGVPTATELNSLRNEIASRAGVDPSQVTIGVIRNITGANTNLVVLVQNLTDIAQASQVQDQIGGVDDIAAALASAGVTGVNLTSVSPSTGASAIASSATDILNSYLSGSSSSYPTDALYDLVSALTGELTCAEAVYPLTGYISPTVCQSGTTHCYKRTYLQFGLVSVYDQGCDTQNLCSSVPASTVACCSSGGQSLICATQDFATSVDPSDFNSCPPCTTAGNPETTPETTSSGSILSVDRFLASFIGLVSIVNAL